MSKFYAQIDANNIVDGVMQTHGEIIASDMIELQSYDTDKLGNLYDPATGVFTSIPDAPIRQITTQAFFRRMTKVERTVLRTSVLDEVADLREDLQRSNTIDLDGILEQQLLDTTLLDQIRIDELLVDGTIEEV